MRFVLYTVAMLSAPEFAVADGHARVYVAIEDTSQIVAIDTSAAKVTETWKIDGGQEPTGLAIDAAHHRLFAGCGGNNVVAIIDTTTGKTLATVRIGTGVDACAYDPAGVTPRVPTSSSDNTRGAVITPSSPRRHQSHRWSSAQAHIPRRPGVPHEEFNLLGRQHVGVWGG